MEHTCQPSESNAHIHTYREREEDSHVFELCQYLSDVHVYDDAYEFVWFVFLHRAACFSAVSVCVCVCVYVYIYLNYPLSHSPLIREQRDKHESASVDVSAVVEVSNIERQSAPRRVTQLTDKVRR